MLVKDYMTKHPVMIEPNVSLVDAQGIMAETHVRHLPVTEKGKRLVGLITRQRLRISPTELGSLNVWEITRYLSNLTVKDVMIKGRDVITIEPDATLERAAETSSSSSLKELEAAAKPGPSERARSVASVASASSISRRCLPAS